MPNKCLTTVQCLQNDLCNWVQWAGQDMGDPVKSCTQFLINNLKMEV